MEMVSSKTDEARTVRIRVYRERASYDVRAAYRAPADADIAAFLKRGALAVLRRKEGWHLLVVAVERTKEGEAIAPVLDRLARRVTLGERDAAAALAVTADGSRAALAVGTRDAAQSGRLRAALAAIGRG